MIVYYQIHIAVACYGTWLALVW